MVSSSYYEIYGGKVYDLLAKKARLRVLEDGKQQAFIFLNFLSFCMAIVIISGVYVRVPDHLVGSNRRSDRENCQVSRRSVVSD